MKSTKIILIIVTFLSCFSYGQDTTIIKSYDQILNDLVKGTELEREIISDSISFDLRLWICNFFYPDKLIQVTHDKFGNWDYHLGYFKDIDTTRIIAFQDSIKKPIDWTQFQSELDSFINSKIPDQDKIDLTLKKNGKTYRINNQTFFTTILDGVAFTIEIYDNNTHKSILYDNPESYLIELKERGLPIKEHEIFIRFTNYILNNFDYKKLQRIQIRDRVDSNKNKKSAANK